MMSNIGVFVEQRLVGGIKIGRRNPEFIGPADSRGNCVGEVLVGADHVDACEIERLARQVRQRLLCVDLLAPLGENSLEIAERTVVGRRRLGLLCRERLRPASG